MNTNDIDIKVHLTILELIEKYKIRLSMWSHSHQELFSYAMKYLLDIIPSDIMPSEVTSEHIILYIKTLQRKVSNASLMTYLNYIKSFFNYIVDEGYIIKSPVRKKDIPRKK